MDFLDELVDPLHAHPTDQKETTSRRLNYMIATALINSDERKKYESEWYKLTEQQALDLCDKLKDSMPIPGHHTTAHSLEEQGRAIRYAVDKDNYYYDERRKDIQPKS